MTLPANPPVQAPAWDSTTTPAHALLDAALRYVERGWPLIDGVYGRGPRDRGWNERPPITTETQARAAFNGEPRQVSLWTGLPGSNLVDVDLDSIEAVQLAPHYLRATPAIWGRPGNPLSHFLYRVTPTDAPTQLVKFADPEQRVLLEVRGRAGHGISTLPPSLHGASGETYRWYSEGMPAEIRWDDLVAQAKTLAAAALLLRAYPKEAGGRNEFARHVAGMLAHAGWPEGRIVGFIQPIIEEALDDDVEGRLRDAVRHTVRQHAAGKPVTGAPTLAPLMGQPTLDRVRELLGLTTTTATSTVLARPDHGLVFVRGADLLAQPEVAQRWVIEQQLPAGGLGLLVGYPKSGKSVTAQNLALAVARGEAFLGRFPTTPGAVYYIAHEEHQDQTRRRLREMGLTSEPVYFAFAPNLQDGLGQLQTALASAPEKPVLVIVDPLFKFTRVKDTSHYAEVSAALDTLMAFTRTTGVSMLALHHTGKGQRDVGQEALGSTGIIGGVDMMWVQRRHSADSGDELYRTLRCSETRYGQTFPELVLALDPATSRLSVAGTRHETERALTEARILSALGKRQDGMSREEIEEVAGVRTERVRPLIRDLVERGAIVPTTEPARGGRTQRKRYFRGACTPVRGVGIPRAEGREQASGSEGGTGTADACSRTSDPTGNNRDFDVYPLVRSDSTVVPAVAPEQACSREQASEAA